MRFFQKLLDVLPDKANVAIWGLSFKPKTDDMREAPSLDLIPMLKKAGHTVRAHDPVAMGNAKKMEPDIEYVNSPMEAAKEADAVIVLTEWDAFRGVDLNELKGVMRGKHLFDGRNIYEPEEVRGAGLQYHGIGVS